MKMRSLITLALAGLMATSLAMPVMAEKMPTDPLGGKPAAGSKPSVENLADQVKYQRAFEAVVWSMPAVIKYGMRRASIEIGAGEQRRHGLVGRRQAPAGDTHPQQHHAVRHLDDRPARRPRGCRGAQGDRQGEPVRADRRQLVHHHRRHRPDRRRQGEGRQDPADSAGLHRQGPRRLHRGEEPELHPRLRLPFHPDTQGHAGRCLRAEQEHQDVLPLGAAESEADQGHRSDQHALVDAVPL